MTRSTLAAVALMMAAACTDSPAGTAVKDQTLAAANQAPEAFAGAWRSVTPSMEFIRLTVVPKSSQVGAFGLLLTFSGVAHEGTGRIERDSLVAPLVLPVTGQSSGTLVARARDERTLAVQVRVFGATTPLELTFVRED